MSGGTVKFNESYEVATSLSLTDRMFSLDLGNGKNIAIPYQLVYNLFKSMLDEVYRTKEDSYTKAEVDNLSTAGIVAIAPGDADDETVGLKFPTESGTYTNYGGIVVDLSEGLTMIFSDGNGTFSKTVVPIDLADYAFASDVEVLSDVIDNISGPSTDLAIGSEVGWISLTDGHLVGIAENVNASSYRTTKFIKVNDKTIIQKTNVLLSIYGADISLVSFYDSEKEYISGLHPSPELAETERLVSDYAPEASYVRLTGRKVGGDVFEVYVNLILNKKNIESLEEMEAAQNRIAAQVESLFSFQEIEKEGLLSGYISSTGVFVPSASFSCTDFIPVYEGQLVKYKGLSGNTMTPIAVFDREGEFMYSILNYGNYTELQEVVIPIGAYFVRFSAKSTVGEVFEFWLYSENEGVSVPNPPAFLPPVSYAVEGEMFRIYPFGVLAKNQKDYGTDVRWSAVNGCQSFWEITPVDGDDDVEVDLLSRDAYGESYKVASTVVKVKHSITSPAANKNVLCLGDSLTLGINSVEGAYVNEFCRRLTGVGTSQGDVVPTSLGLTNIAFIGTLGDQPVKHEGRGGWSANDYLTRASLGGVTNAFWNPETTSFDLEYYLNQNSFKSSQTTGGVDETGSNLVIYLFLGWNDITLYGAESASGYIGQLIDNINTSHPDSEIKLLGLNPPPSEFLRSNKQNFSPEKIMRDFVIAGSIEWSKLTETRDYAEFVPIAPFFSTRGSYTTVTKSQNSRVLETITQTLDPVHPNHNGYAQIADVVFRNFVFHYC